MSDFEEHLKRLDEHSESIADRPRSPHDFDHEYPTYEHRETDFEGPMEPRSPTENELQYLRHVARRLRFPIFMGLVFSFVALVLPVWTFAFDDSIRETQGLFVCWSVFAASVIAVTVLPKRLFRIYPSHSADIWEIREDTPYSESSGQYKLMSFSDNVTRWPYIGGRVQMSPHWDRYLLETLHTSALTYVFPHPDVMTDQSFWGSGPNKLSYVLCCRQIDCRSNIEDTDPILSIDKEVEWGLLKTLYLNPLQWLATMVGGIHAAGVSMVAACLWWNGAPVWASLTEPLVGKILVGVALTLGPLAAFFARRHLRIINRIERKYAEEQNLKPHDWWTRYKARTNAFFSFFLDFELTDDDLVYTEGREQRTERRRERALGHIDEALEHIQKQIEWREALHERLRERGQRPPVETIQQIEDLKERREEFLRRREKVNEHFDTFRDGSLMEMLEAVRESDRWNQKDAKRLQELADESDSEADE